MSWLAHAIFELISQLFNIHRNHICN